MYRRFDYLVNDFYVLMLKSDYTLIEDFMSINMT